MGKGYDVNYRLDKYPDSLELAAIVVEPISGRVLKAYTTEPGMQFIFQIQIWIILLVMVKRNMADIMDFVLKCSISRCSQ